MIKECNPSAVFDYHHMRKRAGKMHSKRRSVPCIWLPLSEEDSGWYCAGWPSAMLDDPRLDGADLHYTANRPRLTTLLLYWESQIAHAIRRWSLIKACFNWEWISYNVEVIFLLCGAKKMTSENK